MTKAPSSIFNSEQAGARARRQLLVFGGHLLWLTPLLFAALVAFNVVTVRLGLPALPQLANIEFQRERLAAAERIDTLFIGDSSLAAMFDPPTWRSLAGEPGLATSLTGAEGYVGGLYLLQRALEQHRPRRVVFVHTADMLTRNVAWRAWFVLRPDTAPVRPPWRRWLRDPLRVYVSAELFFAALKGAVLRLLDRPLPFLVDGFVRPAPALVPGRFAPAEPIAFDVADIDPEKALFLDLIVELCAREGLDCVYAFGPLWDVACAGSQPYLAAARAVIEGRGMPVVDGTPLCAPLAHLDDTEDHVAPDQRGRYTAELHARLAAFEQQRRSAAAAR